MQNNQRHPNLILGIVALLLLIISIGFRANRNNEVGNIVLIASFVLAGVSWLWSVASVLADHKVRRQSENRHIVWVIAVLAVPLVGGILYNLLNRKVSV